MLDFSVIKTPKILIRCEATPSQGKQFLHTTILSSSAEKNTLVNFASFRGPTTEKKMNKSLQIEGFIFSELVPFGIYFLKTVSSSQRNVSD